MNPHNTLQSLNQLNQSIRQMHHLDQLLWYVTDHCTRFLQLEDFVIYTRQAEEDSLIQAAAFGEKCDDNQSIRNPMKIHFGQGIVGLTAKTQQPQIVADTRQSHHYLIDDRQRLSELAVPIIWKDKVIGVIDSEHRHQAYFSTIYADVFCLIAALCAPIMDQLFRKEKKNRKTENKYYHQVIQLLEEEKIYRDKHLSLDSVAQQLEISPIYLSNIINQVGQEPFSRLINKYRIEEVKSLIREGQHRHYNLLSLAYQAGFNSKSSFNYNFKLQTQLTPSAFIKQVAQSNNKS